MAGLAAHRRSARLDRDKITRCAQAGPAASRHGRPKMVYRPGQVMLVLWLGFGGLWCRTGLAADAQRARTDGIPGALGIRGTRSAALPDTAASLASPHHHLARFTTTPPSPLRPQVVFRMAVASRVC